MERVTFNLLSAWLSLHCSRNQFIRLGNHKLSQGKATKRAKTKTIINKKGKEPTNISSIVASSMSDDFIAYTTIPNGGVSKPISTATTETIPNQMMSYWSVCTTGIIKGMDTSRIEEESRIAPKTMKITINIKITTMGGTARDVTILLVSEGKPLTVNILEYI